MYARRVLPIPRSHLPTAPDAIELGRLAHHMRMLSRTLPTLSYYLNGTSAEISQPPKSEKDATTKNSQTSYSASTPSRTSEADSTSFAASQQSSSVTPSIAAQGAPHPPVPAQPPTQTIRADQLPPADFRSLQLAPQMRPLLHSFITYTSQLLNDPWPSEAFHNTPQESSSPPEPRSTPIDSDANRMDPFGLCPPHLAMIA